MRGPYGKFTSSFVYDWVLWALTQEAPMSYVLLRMLEAALVYCNRRAAEEYNLCSEACTKGWGQGTVLMAERDAHDWFKRADILREAAERLRQV